MTITIGVGIWLVGSVVISLLAGKVMAFGMGTSQE